MAPLEIAVHRALFIVLFLAGSALTWADASPKGICGKFPIDHPKRENQPPFRLACEPADGGERVRFPAVGLLEGQKPAAETRVAASPTVPLRKTVPRLIPHPIIAGVVLGGSARGRWVKIDNGNLPEANPSACSSKTGQCCRTLGPEWIPQGLIYKLYSFDEPLGECPGGKAKACDNMATGDIDLTVDFAACPVKKFSLAIAGPWNALPRRPKVLKNHQDFVPVVRNFLDRKGRKRAPVRIEYVHGIDLDGDGMEERIVHALSRKEVGDHGDPNDYSLLLLVRTVQDKPETTAISAWWPGEQENQGPYEIYGPIHYADANGDGVMEIFVDWTYYEGSGIRVYTLRDGKAVETELGYFNGL